MIKLTTLLIGCSLALAAGVQAEQENPPKKPAQKKPVQRQQFVPKQHMAPNNHVQTVHPRTNNPMHNDLPRKQVHTLPAVQSNKLPTVQSHKMPVVPTKQLPAVQSNKFPVNNTVKNFQPQHVNFHAQQNPAIVSAKFNQNFRIHGSENWKGNNYNAFRSYHPQWHDRGWWHSHHNHILLIGGGWYFWNAGYWYPAWGYDTGAAYYPYDGPIYVGNNPTPLDQVVADVQTSLQEQGYYNGEVDGLVGPLTQEALAAYQTAQGLEPTSSIDEPTLAALGLG